MNDRHAVGHQQHLAQPADLAGPHAEQHRLVAMGAGQALRQHLHFEPGAAGADARVSEPASVSHT